MRCHICGTDYDGTHCPHCVTHLPTPTSHKTQQTKNTVLDAEILHDDQQSNGSTRTQSGFTWTSWQSTTRHSTQQNGNINSMQGQFSGLSFYITLALLLACGMQYGFLAAIGFLFFYGIGSILSVFFTVNRLLQGISINPWVTRICNWAICWLLVSWLAR